MSALLKLFGILFLVGVGAWVYFGLQIHKMEQEAFGYVQSKQPPIVEHWNESAFLAETPPQLLREHPKSTIDAMFASYSRLGDLRSAQSPKGKIINFPSTFQGQPLQAVYTTRAQFDRGEATIILSLAKLDGSWKITGLFVSSSAFTREINAGVQTHSTQHSSLPFHNPLDAPSHK